MIKNLMGFIHFHDIIFTSYELLDVKMGLTVTEQQYFHLNSFFGIFLFFYLWKMTSGLVLKLKNKATYGAKLGFNGKKI